MPVKTAKKKPVKPLCKCRIVGEGHPLIDLVNAAKDLVEAVEGPRSVRWASPSGFRLKDTGEWCVFYVAVQKALK